MVAAEVSVIVTDGEERRGQGPSAARRGTRGSKGSEGEYWVAASTATYCVSVCATDAAAEGCTVGGEGGGGADMDEVGGECDRDCFERRRGSGATALCEGERSGDRPVVT